MRWSKVKAIEITDVTLKVRLNNIWSHTYKEQILAKLCILHEAFGVLACSVSTQCSALWESPAIKYNLAVCFSSALDVS